ncbi:uncharacterized protein [Rutidosis leptorrhynchoides]|uniref:uncharacterized protein n=1 Tax=Rutidosis leptorrhynchoides TaxID=125765 RepID=UPI003A9A5F05
MEFLAASLDLLFDSTSSDEEEESPPRRTRVQWNPRPFINRDREAAGLLLWNDYFLQNPAFPDDVFKRRFQMRINLFLRIKDEYLRKLTATDVTPLYLAHEEKHSFKGMLGSIDCMHWAWKNCLVGWKGQYARGDHGHLTIMLEADTAALSLFEVNGQVYPFGYNLADGIYPDWTTLIKGYSTPIDEPRVKFTRFQASARKDVERTFGVLQGSRFAILKTPARVMGVNKMRKIMYSYIVMHNMIQEDNGFALSTWEQEWFDKPEKRPHRNIRRRVKDRRSREKEIRDRNVHDQLREDLTAHIWDLPPNFRSTN